MAADRAKTTLMIALIMFVMIAFILSVTTYLGFQQKAAEQLAAEKSAAELATVRDEFANAQRAFEAVREVLGTDKDTADAIQAERTELFDRRFSAFNEDPKSFIRLVEWLNAAIKTKDEDIKRLDAEKAQIRKEQEAAVAQAQAQQKAAEQARDAAVAEQQKQKADFDQRWAQHQKAQGDMKSKQDSALAESERMRAITEELAKLGPLLSPDLRRRFSAAPPDGQPEPWPERVRFVFRELIERQKSIQELNASLARLGVADPQLQELVRDATPADERIDGFDGRVSSVNSFDRSVLLVCDSTAGMRPGLALSVFDPDDPRPRSGTRKALIEVVEVEGPTLARARIKQDSTTSPILAGDGVWTSLWSPGTAREIAVVGYVRFGLKGDQNMAALKGLIERNGGRVVDAVTPQTALVVDGGIPQANDVQAGLGKDWKPADETVRRRALERAKEAGIRVVSLDGLLETLGIDRATIDGGRLPNAVSAAP